MTSCNRMKYCIPSVVAQFVTAVTNADRFSETKMMYALTKPSCETTIELRIAYRIQGPYNEPPMSPKLPETTNFVFTSSRKEYREMSAMNVSIRLENKIPPLKKLNHSEYLEPKLVNSDSRLAKEQNTSADK